MQDVQREANKARAVRRTGNLAIIGVMVLLSRFASVAYKQLHIRVRRVSTKTVACAMDPDLVEDVHWHELRSKCYRHLMECARDESVLESLVILSVVCEPLRFRNRCLQTDKPSIAEFVLSRCFGSDARPTVPQHGIGRPSTTPGIVFFSE